MRVCLVSPFGDIAALGLRQIAASLKRDGHTVRMIFLTRERYFTPDFALPYARSTLDEVVDLCRGADLVGLTTITNYLASCRQVSRRLKRALPDTPILWGGIHATTCPEASLRHADLVAVGEADETIRDLARRLEAGADPAGTPGFRVRRGDDVWTGPPATLPADLDALPDADWEVEDDYALAWGRLWRLDHRRMVERLAVTGGSIVDDFGGPIFKLMTSRGCLYNCSFCCNNAYRRVYRRSFGVRHRSLDRVMGEIRRARERFPQIAALNFADDLFLGGRIEPILPFARAYKRQVGLPFFCLYSPAQLSRENIDALVDAGLRVMEIGIQSGAESTSRAYRRGAFHEKVLEGANVVGRHAGVLKPRYDFIVDNPFEGMDEVLETLRLVERLPRPHHLALFSLTLYPGTDLHRRGLEDGRVDADGNFVHGKYYMAKEATYVNLLLLMHRSGVDRRVLSWLGRDRVVRALSRPWFRRLAGPPADAVLEALRQRMDILYQVRRMTLSRGVLGDESPVGPGVTSRTAHAAALFAPPLVARGKTAIRRMASVIPSLRAPRPAAPPPPPPPPRRPPPER